MNRETDHIDHLVRQARQGRPEARRELVQVVEPLLAEYVGRMILDRDLATDVVQDTITEMLQILGNLKDPERFWCWLYAITLNKVRAHYRQRSRHKGTSLSQIGEDCLQAVICETLSVGILRLQPDTVSTPDTVRSQGRGGPPPCDRGQPGYRRSVPGANDRG